MNNPIVEQAIEALETAKNGLEWYQAQNPEYASKADDETHELIDSAIEALKKSVDYKKPRGILKEYYPKDHIQIPAEPLSVKRDKWECFCDEAYYQMWAVREVGEKRFGYCFHLNSREEADGLTQILNNTPSIKREDVPKDLMTHLKLMSIGDSNSANVIYNFIEKMSALAEKGE